jgi:hypothetical protein
MENIMTTRYDILSPREDRQGKTRWHKIGAAFPRDKGGFSIVLDALPLPDKEGRVSLLMGEPLERGGQSPASDNRGLSSAGYSAPPSGGVPDVDDEIPFAPQVL